MTALDRLTAHWDRPDVDPTEPILPQWLRDRATFLSTIGNWAKRTGWQSGRFTLHLPAVLALLVWFAPRGLCRLTATVARWAYDRDTADLRAQHARNLETKEFAAAHAARRSNLRTRWMVVATLTLVVVGPVLLWLAPTVLSWLLGVTLGWWIIKAIPGRGLEELGVAVAVCAAAGFGLPYVFALVPAPPVWPVVVAAIVVVLALGWHGRPLGRPLVKGKALPPAVVERLRAPMVTEALCTLGNPRMRDPDQIRLLMDVARQGAGYQIDLELPPGVPASFVQDKREELAAALRRELGCVWPSVGRRHPGHLALYVSDQPMSTAGQAPWPLLKAEPIDVFASAPLFTDNVGKWVTATLAYTAWICGSVPRMGKTYFVRQFGIVAGLDLRTKVLAFDLKGTGDLSALAKFAHAYSVGDDPEDITYQLDRMRWVRAEMRRRAKLLREMTLEENPEKGKVTSALASANPARFGPIVVVADECQVWFEELDAKAVREEFTAICRDLVKRGPALGIIPLFATQKPDAKSIPTAIADNASARLCLKVNGQVSNDQVLGTSSYQAGVRATQFGFEDKGVAYFRGDGRDAQIVRTVHGLDALRADELADKIRALRTQAGLLTGDAAGEREPDETDDTTLLGDVAFVMQDAPRMHLVTILDGLAQLRPGLFGHWDPDGLGAALRTAGVPTQQVKIEGRNTSGVRREDVEAALRGDGETDGQVRFG